MRLSNVKTRRETGLEHVLQSINILTPFGKKRLKEITPFKPGEEEGLDYEFHKVETLMKLAEENPEKTERVREIFMEIKDSSFTIERSKNNTLSVVELFEIKHLLLQMDKIKTFMAQTGHELLPEFILADMVPLLDELDPRHDRLNTFYIYDDFSEKLGELRKERRELELKIRKENKEIKKAIEGKYGISLTPKFDYVVSKANKELIKIIKEIPELIVGDEDYMTVTFIVKNTEEMDAVTIEMEGLDGQIEEEELMVQHKLSQAISGYEESLLENCNKIGELDFVLAKALYFQQRSCVRPALVREHVLEIEDGRHLVVEEVLRGKKKDYCPVSIDLADGVTCITGANMGGKTVSLKLVGLVAMLTQYGFFVPCTSAKVGLSNYIHILIGDNQSVERGLSSFGGEMEELKEMLDHSKDRTLLLIDEIASGTNPVEGLALTKSLIDYLMPRAFISLITTHFDGVTVGGGIKNMQVVGLAEADFAKLEREIRYANRRERIEIISKYMDYRLRSVEQYHEVPKDALNIAKMLGIYDEIIEKAKDYLEA